MSEKPDARDSVGGVAMMFLGMVVGALAGYVCGIARMQPVIFDQGRFAQRCMSAGGEVRDGKCWTKAEEIKL